MYSQTISLPTGQQLLLRFPVSTDANILRDYINQLSAEQTFIRYQGVEISLEDEQKYVDDLVKKISEHQVFHLLGFIDDQLVTVAGIELKDQTEAHQGVLGISVAKDFRGLGIGRKVMEILVSQAPSYMPALRLIVLCVFGNNERAERLYRQFDFEEFGRLPRGIKHRGDYVDEVLMYRKVE